MSRHLERWRLRRPSFDEFADPTATGALLFSQTTCGSGPGGTPGAGV